MIFMLKAKEEVIVMIREFLEDLHLVLSRRVK